MIALLAIRHKKGGVHIDEDKGSFGIFGALELFGALDCISRSFFYFFIYLARDVFICIC